MGILVQAVISTHFSNGISLAHSFFAKIDLKTILPCSAVRKNNNVYDQDDKEKSQD